ncbi:uncharacterized protein zgc:165409 [Platichthys flesus]|uniref:uncharacterized protein zgc:165409 n=1 Tax=Platichthys flesus TaxID=8260 RepID=UPI002DB80E9B|nr:uncharacterized protein zgc:165409 [Platichthys flesus]
MCAVQLMRASVHERISAAAEDFLLHVDRGPEAARVLMLRPMLIERLKAAAEAIIGLFEETVAEYEDIVQRSEREICRQRRLLDAVLKPEVRLHRADVQQLKVNEEVAPSEYQDWISSVDQEDSEPPHIKEEQNELWISQEGEQLQELEQTDIIKFTFTPDTVKTEGDEEEPQSSQLYQRQTEEDRKDSGGPEPAGNSGPDVHLQPCPEDTAINTDVDGIETREPKPMHPSIIRSGRQLVSTSHHGFDQFGCPLCPKFITSRGDTIRRHLNAHVHNAVHLQDTIICRCNMSCRGTGHYHCPNCSKTIMRREDMVLHVTGCKRTSDVTPTPGETTSLVSHPSRTPRADISPPALSSSLVFIPNICFTRDVSTCFRIHKT